MTKVYDKIKDKTGVIGALNASDSDGENEKVFKELRPDSKISFKDFMRKQADMKIRKQMMTSTKIIEN